ncbi:MAG: hypothetical protein U0361_20635 [Nitrospiraceae bacterium]
MRKSSTGSIKSRAGAVFTKMAIACSIIALALNLRVFGLVLNSRIRRGRHRALTRSRRQIGRCEPEQISIQVDGLFAVALWLSKIRAALK